MSMAELWMSQVILAVTEMNLIQNKIFEKIEVEIYAVNIIYLRTKYRLRLEHGFTIPSIQAH